MHRPTIFARIDDRLIHGQVVVGCCGPLDSHRILLVHEGIAQDPFQQRIYAAAVPAGIDVEFLDVEAAALRLADLDERASSTTIVLTGDCRTMLRLARHTGRLARVCVGGLHFREGTRELWPGFFLDEEDRLALRELVALGVEVVVQSVPGNEAVAASPALEREEGRP